MKELKKIGMFLLLFGTAVVIADKTFAYVMSIYFRGMKTGQSGGKINYFLNDYKERGLLIMGDSRGLNQVIPDSFRMPAFNMCHAGMDDVFQESLLDLIISRNRKPQTILLHIDPAFYSGDENTSTALFLKPFYGQSAVLDENIHENGAFEKIKFFFSSYKYNNIVLNIINNSRKELPSHYCGYEPLSATENDSARTAITAQADTARGEYLLNRNKLKHLQHIIQLCKSNHIDLLCFTAPAWKEKKIRTKTIQRHLDTLFAKNEIPYLNFMQNDSPCSSLQQSVLWNDCEHLNDRGAALFSGIIAQEFERTTAAPMPRLKP